MEPVEIPIDGTLDLHTFQPREVAALVADYIAECRRLNILEIRIIHGKEPDHCAEPYMPRCRNCPK